MNTQIRKLFFANFLGGLYFYLPIFTLFLLDKNISLATIMFAQFSYSILCFLFEVPTGVLADRMGHQKSVALGFFVDFIGLLLIVLFPSAVMLIAAQGLRGIGGSLLSGSKEALLYEYCKKANRSYKKDFSHLFSYDVLGVAISTFLTGVIIQVYGQASYVPIFGFTIVSVIIAGILSATLTPVHTQIDTGRDQFHEIRKTWKLFLSTKMLQVLFIVVGLTYQGRYILMDMYQPHMVTNHVIPFFLGAALSIGNVASYFFIRKAYLLEKPLGSKMAITLLTVLTGILYILFGWFTNPYLIIATFVALFGILGAVVVYISDYANSHTPSDIRATVLSGINLSREIFKTGYKLLFAVALGFTSLANVFIGFGIFLFFGAWISYTLLSTVEAKKE